MCGIGRMSNFTIEDFQIVSGCPTSNVIFDQRDKLAINSYRSRRVRQPCRPAAREQAPQERISALCEEFPRYGYRPGNPSTAR
jgi:hypothetical protein